MSKGRIYSPKDFRREIEGFYDVIIIGSGAGGSVASATLAKEKKKVAVIEEGGYYEVKDYKDYFFAIKHMYRDTGSTIALSLPGYPPIALPLGRCVGGTTVINSGTCFRIPEKVIDTWNREEGLEIDKKGLEVFYDEIEKRISVQPVEEDVIGENAKVVRRGAQKLGLNPRPLKRNAKGCEGCAIATISSL